MTRAEWLELGRFIGGYLLVLAVVVGIKYWVEYVTLYKRQLSPGWGRLNFVPDSFSWRTYRWGWKLWWWDLLIRRNPRPPSVRNSEWEDM